MWWIKMELFNTLIGATENAHALFQWNLLLTEESFSVLQDFSIFSLSETKYFT